MPIPYVSPDSTKPVFSAPTTPYSFHGPSHIFSGENASFMSPSGMNGLCYLVAQFNSVGELEHGSVKVVGGIPSLGIPTHTPLLLGSILDVDTFVEGTGPGAQFKANFIFRIDQDHPALGYTSHFGVWNTYMVIPGWPPTGISELFRKNWGPNSAPLNSYIGQVAKVV